MKGLIMNSEIIVFNNCEIEKSLEKLNSIYPDSLENNDIVACGDNKELEKNIENVSAKRSYYNKVTLKNSIIKESAFSGSQFKDFIFKNDSINGNSFLCSHFENFKIISDNLTEYIGNNLSQCYFNSCTIKNAVFISSTWLNSNITNSLFNNCVIKSCTLEGAVFKDCEFNNVDISSANLDYMTFNNSVLNNVTFPLYQFAYIIGASNYINMNKNNKIYFKAGEKKISINEYKSVLKELIHYYYSRKEYFPMSNLLIALSDIDCAKKYIIIGIKCALIKEDYRLIRYFCSLIQYTDILDYELTCNIKSEIDNYLISIQQDSKKLKEALIYTNKINKVINERDSNRTSIQLEIQTNIDRIDKKHQEKVDNLIGDIKYIINNSSFENDGYTIKEISYCPITLALSIIGNALDLASIGMAIQQFLLNVKIKSSTDTRKIAKDICKKYNNLQTIEIDKRIELAKTQIEKLMLELKTYKGKKSGQEYDNFITAITQKMIGDVDKIIDDNMLVFNIIN